MGLLMQKQENTKIKSRGKHPRKLFGLRRKGNRHRYIENDIANGKIKSKTIPLITAKIHTKKSTNTKLKENNIYSSITSPKKTTIPQRKHVRIEINENNARGTNIECCT